MHKKKKSEILTLKLISNVSINVENCKLQSSMGEDRFQNQLEGGIGVTYDGGLW